MIRRIMAVAVSLLAVAGGLVLPNAVALADARLPGIELRFATREQAAREYSQCTDLFPGYLCVWDQAFAQGRIRVFNNEIIGSGVSFYGTSWDNVITNAYNTAHSTTYRVWNGAHCTPNNQPSGTLSPGAIGGWNSTSVFYHNISGITIDGDTGC